MSPDRYKYFQECTRAPFCPVSTRNIDQLAVVEGSLCQALSNLWPSPLMVMYRAEKKLLLDNGITSCVTIFCRMIGLGQVIILHTNIANKLNTPRPSIRDKQSQSSLKGQIWCPTILTNLFSTFIFLHQVT